MVHLSPSPTLLGVTPPPERPEETEEDLLMADSQEVASPAGLETSTAYWGYDSYIEDGLICLKHKVRNLEKKKLKLEDYTKRLNCGKELNKDQMAAVLKYEEVLHHLAFARELHKTLDGLTHNLLRAHKKAAKKEQVIKVEMERRRLSTVLQIQHLLHSMLQEHIRRDLMAGHNQAPHISAQKLLGLSQLAPLLGLKRDNTLSLEKQMEQAALVYLDLLEGKDEPVAGSTFKLLKEELDRLLNCKYFSCLPPPPTKNPLAAAAAAAATSSSSLSTTSKSKRPDVSKEFFNSLYLGDTETPPTHNWKGDLQTTKEREPPDCWDLEFSEGPSSPHAAVHKPWRGAATFIPRVPVTTKTQHADCKQAVFCCPFNWIGSAIGAPLEGSFSPLGEEYGLLSIQRSPDHTSNPILVAKFVRKERRVKSEQHPKSPLHMDMPMEVLPKDPVLRKQHLEDLMTKIHGSFSFMQDSLLEGEMSPINGLPKLMIPPSGSPSPLGHTDSRSSVHVLPTAMHSTPLPARLTNGDQCLETCDLKLSSKDLPHSPGTELGKQSPFNEAVSCTPTQGQNFSPPPTRRTLSSAHFQSIQSVFKVNASLPQNGELNYKPDCAVLDEPRYSSASTQTPPEFAPLEDELQPVYQSDYNLAGNGGSVFLSPGQSGGNGGRSGPSHYTRGSVRGMARGGKGRAQTFRSSGWHRGGSYTPQTHPRDSGPLLYAARDSGYQHGYRRGGGRNHSSAAWSDTSQVSTPDREGVFTIVDSGLGDSMSVSTMEVPLTPHGHHHALLPMQLYPLSQPLRVAFSTSRTANFAPGNLDQPIVFDQLHCNLGEMYDAHIGRFTCPSNGTYVFIFHILKLAINVPLYINLMRNEEVMVSAYANDGAPDHETASNHTILPLFQGDQVWLRLHRGAIYGSTWKYSTFSGFLLYQD